MLTVWYIKWVSLRLFLSRTLYVTLGNVGMKTLKSSTMQFHFPFISQCVCLCLCVCVVITSMLKCHWIDLLLGENNINRFILSTSKWLQLLSDVNFNLVPSARCWLLKYSYDQRKWPHCFAMFKSKGFSVVRTVFINRRIHLFT